MLYRVMLIGNLGADPDYSILKTKNGDLPKVRFSVATHPTREGPTVWEYVEALGSTADACLKALRKGSRVFVEGDMRCFYKKGEAAVVANERRTVSATKVVFLSPKPTDGDHSPDPQASVQSNAQPSAPEDFDDDDIPF